MTFRIGLSDMVREESISIVKRLAWMHFLASGSIQCMSKNQPSSLSWACIDITPESLANKIVLYFDQWKPGDVKLSWHLRTNR